jgi:hypothetical protein
VVEEASAQAADAAAVPGAAPARQRLRAVLAAFCDWAGAHEAFARVLVRECLMGTPRRVRKFDPAANQGLLKQCGSGASRTLPRLGGLRWRTTRRALYFWPGLTRLRA